MKSLLLLFLLSSFLSTFSLQARQLSLKDAVNRINKCAIGRAKAPVHPQLLATGTKDGLNCYYVVKDANGFTIVSADDVAVPVLGSVDLCDFDTTTMPPAMANWLECVKIDISQASLRENEVSKLYPYCPGGNDVPPLLHTMWNQVAPLNNFCPELDGRRSLVGCVATSSTMVMNHHRWPLEAKGSVAYHAEKLDRDMEMDFTGITFDWDLILPCYWNGYSQEQADEIAKLSYVVGMAEKMDYHPDASAAYMENAMAALVNNFSYDANMARLWRNSTDRRLYLDILYGELAAGRPVLYDGYPHTGEDGHAFVIDGYRADDGFYHLNWGWSGGWDGYFAIDVLLPGCDYSANTAMIVGVMPEQEGTNPWVMASDGLSIGIPDVEGERDLNLNAFYKGGNDVDRERAGFQNHSYGTFEGEIGVMLKNIDTPSDSLLVSLKRAVIEQDSTLRNVTFSSSLVPSGRWRVIPMLKVDGTAQWSRMVVNTNGPAEAYLSISDDRNDFSTEQTRPVPIPLDMGWESIGTAQVTDGVMEDVVPDYYHHAYQGSDYVANVLVYQSRTAPGNFLLTGVYQDFARRYLDSHPENSYRAEEDFMLIDATNADSVMISRSHTGIVTAHGTGEVWFASEGWNNFQRDSVPGDAEFGKWRNYEITFPANSIEAVGLNHEDCLANSSGRMRIVLPVESGISELTFPIDENPRYYDLWGREVILPTKGIFIEIRNGKATKRVI